MDYIDAFAPLLIRIISAVVVLHGLGTPSPRRSSDKEHGLNAALLFLTKKARDRSQILSPTAFSFIQECDLILNCSLIN